MKTVIFAAADASILLISSAGIAISVAMALWGVAIAPGALQGSALFVGVATLVGVLLVGVLFVLRQQATGELGPPDYSGCPPWLRFACYALIFSGVALFFLPAVLQFCGISPAFNGLELPSTLPGGFGLMGYTGIFGQTYSSVALRDRTDRLPPAA